MEAEFRVRSWCSLAVAGLFFLVSCGTAEAASKRTQNFIINAPTPQLAEAVGEAAERYRRDLATYWLGGPLPPWPAPCPVTVIAGDNLAAQGVTTYNPAPVRDFQMEVVGTPERILDSVLPHEVTHTILATYFGRPLPRWADEGICTTVEHEAEKSKHEAKLREFLRSRRGIAMNQLFLMKEYPADVLPMYAQGYSVCRFLIEQQGPRTFIEFLGAYMKQPSWTRNVKQYYGYGSLKELQDFWLAWVAEGSGPVDKFAKVEMQPARNGLVRQASATQPAAVPDPRALAAAPAGRSMALQAPESAASTASVSPANLAAPQNQIASRDAGARTAPSATTLASKTSGGWYQRKREEVESLGQGGGDRAPVSPIVPPSVRDSGPYQTAHPQSEQQMSRGGSPVRWSAGSPNHSGQFVR